MKQANIAALMILLNLQEPGGSVSDSREQLGAKLDQSLTKAESFREIRTNIVGTKSVASVWIESNGGYNYECLILATMSGDSVTTKRVCASRSLDDGSGDRIWISNIGQPGFLMPLLQVEMSRIPADGEVVEKEWITINLETAKIFETSKDDLLKVGLITVDTGGIAKDQSINVSGIWFPERACIVVGEKSDPKVLENLVSGLRSKEATVKFAQKDSSTVTAVTESLPAAYHDKVSKILTDWFKAQRNQEIRVEFNKTRPTQK